MDEMTIRSLGYVGVAEYSVVGLAMASFLLIAVSCILRFWGRFSGQGVDDPHAVTDLYLSIGFKSALSGHSQKSIGFLRSLTLNRATLVVNNDYDYGSAVEIDLGRCNIQLSSEVDKPCYVPGKVIKTKSLGGQPESWLLDIKFEDQPCNQASTAMAALRQGGADITRPSIMH